MSESEVLCLFFCYKFIPDSDCGKQKCISEAERECKYAIVVPCKLIVAPPSQMADVITKTIFQFFKKICLPKRWNCGNAFDRYRIFDICFVLEPNTSGHHLTVMFWIFRNDWTMNILWTSFGKPQVILLQQQRYKAHSISVVGYWGENCPQYFWVTQFLEREC